MYASLIKKDFNMLFRENIRMVLFQNLFVLVVISASLGIVGYGVMAVSFGWQILMIASTKDKENDTMALLVSMPYDKSTIINARFLSAIIGFIGVTIAYIVLSTITLALHIPFFKMLNLQVFLTTFCTFILFVSITLPLYLIFEDTVVRLISIVMILAPAFIGVLLWNYIKEILNVLSNLQEYYQIVYVVIALIILTISRSITLSIFKKMQF